MGESRRRKLLDPTYGKPKLPENLLPYQERFLAKEIDFAVQPIGNVDWTVPIEAQKNPSRLALTKSIQQIQKEWLDGGKGLVMHHEDKVFYVPGEESLQSLNEILPTQTANVVRKIIGVTFEPANDTPELIPVVALGCESNANALLNLLIPVIALHSEIVYVYCL